MLQKFFRDSFVYTFAGFFTKGLGFLMLPVYLSYLDKVEYGIFDYLTTVGSILSVIVSLEVSQAVLRFSSELNNNIDEKAEYVSSGVIFTVSTYALLVIFVYLNLDGLSASLTHTEGLHIVVLLAACSYFSSALLYLTTVIYRSNLDAKSVGISSAISGALSAGVSYVMLSRYELGLHGVLLGLITGQLTVALFNLFELRRYWLVKPNMKKMQKMLKFSAPLVVSGLGVVLSSYVDRLMIKEMLGLSALAEYGVAARLATGATLLTIGFQASLSPLIYSNVHGKETPQNIRKLFLYYSAFGFVFILLAIIFSGEFFSVFLSGAYSSTSEIFVILFASVVVFSGYLFFPGVSIIGKTHILAYINLVSGFLNFGLNFILIPIYGLYGAAFATLVSAVFYFLVNMYQSEK